MWGVAANIFGRPLSHGIIAGDVKTLRECVWGAAAYTFGRPLSLGM